MAAPTPAYRAKLKQSDFLLSSPLGEFWLPVPPQAVRPRQPIRFSYMEASEWAEYDVQGLGAPEWDIDGQFLLSAGGYASHRQLEQFVSKWAEENRKAGIALSALLPMEFHDFFAGQHWEVVPQVVPLGERNASSPLTERYSLKLKGVRPVGAASPRADAVQDAMEADVNAEVAKYCPVEGAAL